MSTRSGPNPGGNPWLPLLTAVTILAAAGLLSAAVNLARWTAGQPAVWNPVELVFGLITGRIPWPGALAVVLLVGFGVVLLALATVLIWIVRRWRFGSTRVDRNARKLARRQDLAPYSPSGVAASAERLRPRGAGDDPRGHGVLVGKTVPGGMEFRSSWEDTEVDIWGPRTGKSTARAIPSIVDAPGAVIATSNKRDVHDATRGVRAYTGQVWVFDPQDIVGDDPTFWFNPLDYVTGPREAAVLTSHFVAGTRPAEARTDAYFDGEGENLMGYFFLAAARAGEPITTAYQWAANSYDHRALEILQHSGDQLLAAKLQSIMEAPDKQREGVYSSALKLLRCLEDPRVLRWVVPPSSPRAKFDPTGFLHTRDTLYLLSKEGEGSASPLVASLTHAVLEAGEHAARGAVGARLDPPLLCVLDEAANVCRIRELPNLYSHFGSRGMLVMTILQSWEQGVEVWGKSGMQKLWDTANVRVYGGGVADAEFLGRMSQLIGEHDQITHSETRDRSGHTSRNISLRRQKIYDVSDLAALPRGRAVVLASGVPPTLIEPVPWMAGPHAEQIRQSLATYDPGQRRSAEPTVATPFDHAQER